MAKQHRKPSTKTRRQVWFTPIRGSYLPASWQAWACYVPYVAYLIFALVAGWQTTSSSAQAILFVIPNWIAATAVMTWIARRTS